MEFAYNNNEAKKIYQQVNIIRREFKFINNEYYKKRI